jgi:hypothetical protein
LRHRDAAAITVVALNREAEVSQFALASFKPGPSTRVNGARRRGTTP